MKRSSSLLPYSLLLITLSYLFTYTNAALVQPRYAVNLRPRSRENSRPQDTPYVKRQAIPSCGDASGNTVDVEGLVAASIAEGLPSASDAGVVFMEAVIATTDACGPYACFVSADAKGTSWGNMIMFQNVPTVEDGCSTAEGSNVQTLVASFPKGTNCTGPDGACLVMCKAPNIPLGNCAAVAWSPEDKDTSSTRTPYTSTTHDVPTPVATITSIIDKTQTTIYTTAPRHDAVPDIPKIPFVSEGAAPPSSSTSTGRAAPTLQGFSGDNGPGGRSEQNLNFGESATPGAVNGTAVAGVGIGAASSMHSNTIYTSLAIALSTATIAYLST